MITILWDTDMLVYRSASAVAEYSPFDKTLLIRADIEEAKNNIQGKIKEVEQMVFDHFDQPINSIHCISGKSFRYKVEPNYKSNRKGKPKPPNYNELIEWIEATYETAKEPELEADDVMGLMQEEDTIICSGDKDMRQIGGYHVNLINPENKGIESVDPEDGFKFFLQQCISGDPVDGYQGIPSWGATKAVKWLDKHGYTFDSVVKAYESAMSPKTKGGKKVESVNLGLGYDDALLTARMAYILNKEEDYNIETKEIELWQPS